MTSQYEAHDSPTPQSCSAATPDRATEPTRISTCTLQARPATQRVTRIPYLISAGLMLFSCWLAGRVGDTGAAQFLTLLSSVAVYEIGLLLAGIIVLRQFRALHDDGALLLSLTLAFGFDPTFTWMRLLVASETWACGRTGLGESGYHQAVSARRIRRAEASRRTLLLWLCGHLWH